MVALAALTNGVAGAKPNGHWVETGHSVVPLEYFQGVTSGPGKLLYFDGTFTGLYRTDSRLREQDDPLLGSWLSGETEQAAAARLSEGSR